VTESDADGEFAEVATVVLAGIVAKGKFNRNKSQMIISVTCTSLSGLK